MKKRILCIGDSNTYGYCADPSDCAEGGSRFNEDERYTCLLQKLLGDGFHVTEEGMGGRTTVFPDPLSDHMDLLCCLDVLLKSHGPLDLVTIMLGTNDTKERLHASTATIARGIERIVLMARSYNCWAEAGPNILIICPPPIPQSVHTGALAEEMGPGCADKCVHMAEYFKATADLLGVHFLDAADCPFNSVDFMHLTREGHRMLAEHLAQLIPTLL